jgi:hypothetical protein
MQESRWHAASISRVSLPSLTEESTKVQTSVGYSLSIGKVIDGFRTLCFISCLYPRSSSMSIADRQPLANAPASDRIRQHADNRLGAVYSALYSFWSARHAVLTAGQQAVDARRDAYSIIFFDSSTHNLLVNDLEKNPDQLLDTVLGVQTSYGTNFTAALRASQSVMKQHWSMERFVTKSSPLFLVTSCDLEHQS